jgi:protein-disulfide isomerase
MDKEMKQHLLQMLELLLARQEETAARLEEMYAELKAAILASFRGSTTCQAETTSSKDEMEATNLGAMPEEGR